MDVHLRRMARAQLDLVARWQLLALGFRSRQIDERAFRREWRVLHPGVYSLAQGPLTPDQRWLAACLTEPGTMLGFASAAACWGFFRDPAMVMVVRPGSGGPRRFGGVMAHRSSKLSAETTWRGPIPLTSPERTLIDLSPHLNARQRGRATREAIRVRATTAPALLNALDRHRGRRGTAALRVLATMYAELPVARTRSDAEALALERLFRAELPIPAVNEQVGDHEADLIDHRRRLIVEIDGPANHLFPDEDARRDAAWAAAGYTVRRLPSDAIYE